MGCAGSYPWLSPGRRNAATRVTRLTARAVASTTAAIGLRIDRHCTSPEIRHASDGPLVHSNPVEKHDRTPGEPLSPWLCSSFLKRGFGGNSRVFHMSRPTYGPHTPFILSHDPLSLILLMTFPIKPAKPWRFARRRPSDGGDSDTAHAPLQASANFVACLHHEDTKDHEARFGLWAAGFGLRQEPEAWSL
jgi:hypothetical protein